MQAQPLALPPLRRRTAPSTATARRWAATLTRIACFLLADLESADEIDYSAIQHPEWGATPSPTCLPGQGGIPQGDAAIRQRNGSRVGRRLLAKAGGFFLCLTMIRADITCITTAPIPHSADQTCRRGLPHSSRMRSHARLVGHRQPAHGKTAPRRPARLASRHNPTRGARRAGRHPPAIRACTH
jgi:hypothetical protein